MTNDHKYERAVSLAARDITRLRKAVHIQSAALAVLSAAVVVMAVRKERKHDPP